MATQPIQVTNYNALKEQQFKFVLKRIPHVEFFVTNFTPPAITANPIILGNPFIGIKEPGDHMELAEFDVEFIVDEDLKNYDEIKTWMDGLYFPKTYTQSAALANTAPMTDTGRTSDATLTLLTNNNNRILDFQFTDAFPISLNLNPMNVQSVEDVKATAGFAFTVFNIVR